MKYVSVLALLFLMLLASCANRAQTGAAGGAAAGALIGQVMKAMRGQADAGMVRELILSKLS